MKTYKNPVNIVPSRREKLSASTWEVRDNRNKLVGTFDTNKVTEATDRNDARRIAEYQWIGSYETVYDIREAGLKEPLPTDWMISTLDKLVKQGMKFPEAGYMKWEDKYICSQDYTYFHPGGWKPMRLPDGYEIVVRR